MSCCQDEDREYRLGVERDVPPHSHTQENLNEGAFPSPPKTIEQKAPAGIQAARNKTSDVTINTRGAKSAPCRGASATVCFGNAAHVSHAIAYAKGAGAK